MKHVGLLAALLFAGFASAARMPADHWIGPRITPQEYLASNQGLYVLDESGILVTLYRDRNDQAEPRKEYNPAFIANYAITACRAYVAAQDTAALGIARKQLDWLLANGKPLTYRGITARMYPYTFDWVKFQLKAPWVSAFAQSLIGVAFACGADATGSDEYLQGARLAFNGLRIPVARGGVTTFTGGSAWFEEAAKAGFPSIKILNGHLTAAEGLKNFIDWLPEPTYQRLWNQHLHAVRRNLRSYDAGFLSYYSQYPAARRQEWEPSGRVGYNAVHTIQLVRLYETTGWPVFLRYALKFAQYETPNLTITTAGSTAADTNGPDRINMVMGNDYWSHATFPTWAQVDMGEIFDVTGLYLVAHTQISAPRDYSIEVSTDGRKFERVVAREGNAATVRKEVWPAVRARYVRVNINSDNGNQNVTLKGLYPLRTQPFGAVVAGARDMSVRNMPAQALTAGGWSAPRQGWLAFRRDALPGGVRSIVLSPADSGTMTLSQGFPNGSHPDETPLSCSANECRFAIPERGDNLVSVKWRVAGSGSLRALLR